MLRGADRRDCSCPGCGRVKGAHVGKAASETPCVETQRLVRCVVFGVRACQRSRDQLVCNALKPAEPNSQQHMWWHDVRQDFSLALSKPCKGAHQNLLGLCVFRFIPHDQARSPASRGSDQQDVAEQGKWQSASSSATSLLTNSQVLTEYKDKMFGKGKGKYRQVEPFDVAVGVHVVAAAWRSCG